MQYSNQQLLQILKEIFIKDYEEVSKKDKYATVSGIAWHGRDVTFPFMIELFEYSGFPTIVPDEGFDSIKSKQLYRGVYHPEHTANVLCDFNYHYGEGMSADGIYASSDYSIAKEYTGDERETENKDYILDFKLDPSARICDYKSIVKVISNLKEFYYGSSKEEMVAESLKVFEDEINYAEIQQKIKDLFDFIDSLDSELEKEIVVQNFSQGKGKLSIYLGYDAIQIEPSLLNCAIFNRGKMIVPQSEFDRFIAYSNDYNADGTIKRLSGNDAGEECGEKIPQKC